MFFAKALDVPVRSTVGTGDNMLAGAEALKNGGGAEMYCGHNGRSLCCVCGRGHFRSG